MSEKLTLPSLLKLSPSDNSEIVKRKTILMTPDVKRNIKNEKTPSSNEDKKHATSYSVTKKAKALNNSHALYQTTRTPRSPTAKMIKLYNPQLFEKYSHKINIVREKYENLYQQYFENPLVGEKNLSELVSTTENIINSTYSIKYFGINNNQIGILSRRVPLKNMPKEINYREKSGSRSPEQNLAHNSKIMKKENSLQSIDCEKVNINDILRRQSIGSQTHYVTSSIDSSHVMNPTGQSRVIELRATAIRPSSRPEMKKEKSGKNIAYPSHRDIFKNAIFSQLQEPKILERKSSEPSNSVNVPNPHRKIIYF